MAKKTSNNAVTETENIVLVPLKAIDCSERLRPIDSDYAAAIASSIERDGLLQPIDICHLPNQASGLPYRLVAGGHRIEAFRILGRSHIPVFIRSHEADKRRAREIAENIFKAELKPYERAVFVAEMVAIEKRRAGLEDGADGRKISAAVRWSDVDSAWIKNGAKDANATIALACGWSDSVAEKLKLSRRSIYNNLELLRINPSVITRLQEAKSSILENAAMMRTLAKLSPETQSQICDEICVGTAPKTAISKLLIKPKTITPTQKAEKALVEAWTKLSPLERAGILWTLRSTMPKGVKIQFDSKIHTFAERANG